MPPAARLRARMVDALRDTGRVRSPAVEQALRAVPRHLFLPGVDLEDAYADEAVPVQHVDGVTTSSASQPSMMAIMLEQLDLRPGHRVLEIGAGTGYNAALMAHVVGPTGRVCAVDIDADLVQRAAGHLAAAGVAGVELRCADGALGHPAAAPYDRIVLTVGSGDVRPEWLAQLAPAGRLLLPLAVRGSQLSVALDSGPDGLLRSASVRGCAFIRLRGVGAEADAAVELPGGLVLEALGDGPGVDPAALAALLLAPGALVAAPVRLAAPDVWHGYGLWLALTEPGAARLLAGRTAPGLPDPLLAGGGTVALVPATPHELPGLAVLVPAPGAGTDATDVVAARPFGPGGPPLASRLLAAAGAWIAAGSPRAPDWRITVVPAGAAAVPVPEPEPGAVLVRKEHCALLLDLPGGATP